MRSQIDDRSPFYASTPNIELMNRASYGYYDQNRPNQNNRSYQNEQERMLDHSGHFRKFSVNPSNVLLTLSEEQIISCGQKVELAYNNTFNNAPVCSAINHTIIPENSEVVENKGNNAVNATNVEAIPCNEDEKTAKTIMNNIWPDKKVTYTTLFKECQLELVPNNPKEFQNISYRSQSCIHMILLGLFLNQNDDMLLEVCSDGQTTRQVKNVVRDGLVIPLREERECSEEYVVTLHSVISKYLSVVKTLEAEELLTILFECIFKIPPLVNYCGDMTDYIHQFFIDFTDTRKYCTTNWLYKQSLEMQQLSLEGIPFPFLILQMPFHTNDSMLFYEAVVPSPTLRISTQISGIKNLVCYCNGPATFKCTTCEKDEGLQYFGFCEECKHLHDNLTDKTDHQLQNIVESLKNNSRQRNCLHLAAIICLNEDGYSAFVREGQNEADEWVYIGGIESGKLKKQKLTHFQKWLESVETSVLVNDEQAFDIPDLPIVLQKVLQHGRLFIYD